MTIRHPMFTLLGAGFLIAGTAVAQVEISPHDDCLLNIYMDTVAKDAIETALVEFPDQAREPFIEAAKKMIYQTRMDNVREFYALVMSKGTPDICSGQD